ncbi:kinesin motor domain-containing protein [Cystoisospora suis]|uniref:Kinesin motor domain-containing protein n=1 Tax=Cystoisospora suis TaxID=483139 RepID=A0A2C6LEH1_9APIC|nr:kinesin motor domain-containing protein [Cystoisospora suis]
MEGKGPPFDVMEVEAQTCVRLRPLSLQRIEEGARPAYILEGSNSLLVNSDHVIEDPEVVSALSDVIAEQGLQHGRVEFSLDGKIYDETASTSILYAEQVQPFVIQLTEGISSTVLTYGPCGSGKTFSLFGSLDHPGMVSCALHDLFAHIASYRSASSAQKKPYSPILLSWDGAGNSDRLKTPPKNDSLQYEFSVRCSYVEIRKNSIVDLFKCAADYATTDLLPTLSIVQRSGPPVEEAVTIQGLTERPVTHIDESVREILKAAAFQKARDRLFPDLPASSIFRIIVERACITKDGKFSKDSSSPIRDQKQDKKDYVNNKESSDIPDSTGLSPSHSSDPCMVDITLASLTFVETPGTEALMIPSSSIPGVNAISPDGIPHEESLFFLTEILLRLANKQSESSLFSNSQKDEDILSLCEASVTTQLLQPQLTGHSNLLLLITLDPADTSLSVSIPVLRFASSFSGCLRHLCVNRIPIEKSHLRSLHVALLRRYRELLALQEKREDEKALRYFASRLGDRIIIEDEKDLSTHNDPSPNLHRTSWWRVSPTELQKRMFDVKEDLKKLRQQILLGGYSDWEKLEGCRLSCLLEILSSLKDRLFLRSMLNDDEESPTAVYYRQIRELSRRPIALMPFHGKRQDSSSSSSSSPSPLRRNERSVFFSEDTKVYDDKQYSHHHGEGEERFSMSSMRKGMKSRSLSPTSRLWNLRADSSRFSQHSRSDSSFHHSGSSSCDEGGFFNSFGRQSRKEETDFLSSSSPAARANTFRISHGNSHQGRFHTKEKSRSFNRFLSEGGISRCFGSLGDDSAHPFCDVGVRMRYKPFTNDSYKKPPASSFPVKAYNITRQQRGFHNVSVCTPQPDAEATGPSVMSRRGHFFPSDGFVSLPIAGRQPPQEGALQNIVQSYTVNENRGSPYSFYEAPSQSEYLVPSALPDMAPVVITRRTRAAFPGGEDGRSRRGWQDSYAGTREEDATSAPCIMPNVFVGMLTVSLNDESFESVPSQQSHRSRSSGSPPLPSRPSSSHADEVAKAMEELEKSLAEMRESLQWRDDQVKADVREKR